MPSLKTVDEVLRGIADRVMQRRLDQGWTRRELAERAGLSFSTLRRFERTGQVSLERLIHLASFLDALDGFDQLFLAPPARSLADIEQRTRRRQRGRRKAG